MQQCMKSNISSTQGNRAAVPACTGTRVCWSGAGLGPGRGGGDCREGCLIARWFAGTAPGATLGLWQAQVTGLGCGSVGVVAAGVVWCMWVRGSPGGW